MYVGAAFMGAVLLLPPSPSSGPLLLAGAIIGFAMMHVRALGKRALECRSPPPKAASLVSLPPPVPAYLQGLKDRHLVHEVLQARPTWPPWPWG